MHLVGSSGIQRNPAESKRFTQIDLLEAISYKSFTELLRVRYNIVRHAIQFNEEFAANRHLGKTKASKQVVADDN